MAFQISEKKMLGILGSHFKKKHQLDSDISTLDSTGKSQLQFKGTIASDDITPISWRSSYNGGARDFHITGKLTLVIKNNLLAQFSDQVLSINPIATDIFSNTFHLKITSTQHHGPPWVEYDGNFSIKFKLSQVLQSFLNIKNADNDTAISFNKDTSKTLAVEITEFDKLPLSDPLGKELFDNAKEKLENSIKHMMKSLANELFNFTLPSGISTFAIQNLILPLGNKADMGSNIKLQNGNLLLRGTVKAPAHTVTPSESILTQESTQQFSINPSSIAVQWAVHPSKFGQIDNNGLFTANNQANTSSPFIIKATHGGKTATALCYMTNQTLTIHPQDMCIVKDSATHSFKINSLKPIQSTQWELEVPGNRGCGNIDSRTGRYTPPDTLPNELCFISAKATGTYQDGIQYQIEKPIILQGSNEIQFPFRISPPFISKPLQPSWEQSITFSAKKTNRFSPSKWMVYPSWLGHVSEPQEKEGVYTTELTIIPTLQITPYMLGFVVAYDPNNDGTKDQVGVAVFTVAPPATSQLNPSQLLEQPPRDDDANNERACPPPSAAALSASSSFFGSGISSHAKPEENTTTPTLSSS